MQINLSKQDSRVPVTIMQLMGDLTIELHRGDRQGTGNL